MPQDIRNIKTAVFAGFLPEPGQTFDEAALDLRAALLQCALPLETPEIDTYLRRLHERLNGDRIETRCVRDGLDRRMLAATPRFVEAFGTTTFRFRQIVVGIDIFNAGGEFGVGSGARSTAVELFCVDRFDPDQFVDLVGLLFERTRTSFVFGGMSFFAENFAHLKATQWVDGVDELLWPLTAFTHSRPPSANVFRALSLSRGVVLQVFEDLWTGPADAYAAAAEETGLHSFWHLKRSSAAKRRRSQRRRATTRTEK